MTEIFQLAVGLLALIVGVLWLILPFAIFGIKSLLKELVEVSKNNNRN